MVCVNTRFIRHALRAARELIVLADDGEAAAPDDGCAILVGVVRDCGYQIRAQAEREMKKRQAQGIWEELEAHPQ